MFVINQILKCRASNKIFHPLLGLLIDAFNENLEENTFVAFIMKHHVYQKFTLRFKSTAHLATSWQQ